jgi:hypothetical protein
MSQASLGDFTAEPGDGAGDNGRDLGGARYSKPDSDAAPKRPVGNPQVCQGCGSPMPERRRRLIGDNGNVVWHCLDCPGVSKVALRNGAGAKPDYPIGEGRAPEHHSHREAMAAAFDDIRGVGR